MQELFHFLKGEPEISALPDKSETLPLRVGVAPMTALSSCSFIENADLFVIPDRGDFAAGSVCEFTDGQGRPVRRDVFWHFGS